MSASPDAPVLFGAVASFPTAVDVSSAVSVSNVSSISAVAIVYLLLLASLLLLTFHFLRFWATLLMTVSRDRNGQTLAMDKYKPQQVFCKKKFGTPLEIKVFHAVTAKGTSYHRRKVNIQ